LNIFFWYQLTRVNLHKLRLNGLMLLLLLLLLLLLWPPYVIGGPLYLCPVVSFFLLSSSSFFPSPNLSGHRLDVYHTSTHGVALVRIWALAHIFMYFLCAFSFQNRC